MSESALILRRTPCPEPEWTIKLDSPFVSLHLSPVVSQPEMPGSLGGRGFICLPLSPFICLRLSPSLNAWHGSLGGQVHLSRFVSLHLSYIFLGGRVHLSPFVSLHLSSVVSQPGCLARLSLCLPSFVSRCLLAWISGWTGSFVSLCLPSFASASLPA